MGCSTKYRTESSFRIEGGMRYQMLTRKVEIHISPRANKKLLSPRALSFAGAPWETTSRKGTMQEEKSGNRICYSLVEERTYRQSRTRASSFILPIDRPTACARIERTRSAKEYENWRVAAEVLCSSVCPLNSRHQRKGNVDRLFLRKRKAAKKRGIAQWFDLIGAETRQASESCRFPYLLLVKSFTMLRECNCVWICFCTHFLFLSS